MKKYVNKGAALAVFPISALSLFISSAVYAQTSDQVDAATSEQQQQEVKPRIVLRNPMEDMLILGRIQSAAGDIVLERMEQEVAVDLISAELIARVGDSDVASALRRVTGITLVDDKFVMVRGLGERYSSTSLNGAVIPSPDLTRNVVPLDLFPTSIVQTISVQKMASADMPASFGGGAIDIRTKGLPDDFLFSVGLGLGGNSESGDFYTYSGGGDDDLGEDDGTRALSPALSNALNRYRGDFENIAGFEGIPGSEAEAVNRGLALELNRGVNIEEESGSPDRSLKLALGNTFVVKNDMEIGFLAGLSYDSSWRNTEKTFVLSGDRIEGESSPFQDLAFEKESTYNVSLLGNFSLGLRLNDENEISTTSIFIRNTDDKASIRDKFDSDSPITSGTSSRLYSLRYEQRELLVNQIRGEHEFGSSTRDTLGLNFFQALDGLKFNWFYSDSESTTNIPNEVKVGGSAGFISPFSLETTISTVSKGSSAADYRFTELEDYVDSYGWDVAFPIETDRFTLELSGGAEAWQKSRTYKQLQFGLGSSDLSAPPNIGLPGEVFSDANVADEGLGFQVSVTSENSDSYIAANKVNAAFGKFDINWNETIRIAAGLRWEDYQQVGLSWEVLDFEGSQLVPNGTEARAFDETVNQGGQPSNVIADYFNEATFVDSDIFGSLAVTYMAEDFLAEDFQLRFGYSETTVRPDLREITGSSYIDPINDFLVFGDPDLIPAQFKNYDVRAEWYFTSGDNMTLSFFYKDITDPIDVEESARSDDGRAIKVFNTESAEITGFEFEFLKSLGNVSDILEPFFIQGNVTILNTNTVVGERGISPTNAERPLVNAGDTLNLIFGYDSDDGKHAATLSYNWFGERLSFAGRAGQADVYEQASSSLDLTYSYYPTEQFTVKLKTKNLSDETNSWRREGESFTDLEEGKGLTYSLSVDYTF
ncbi:MAG: TonB-dependent receptor [Lentisphaeria bacterium]|jgi:TonB-dependent receptor